MGEIALTAKNLNLKVGDIFTIGNSDAPDWTKGNWKITRILPEKIKVKRVVDKSQ